MNCCWQIKNLKVLPLICQLGFKNGLQSGDNPTTKEFLEAYERHPDWLEKLGHTELTKDEWVKELNSKGKKVLRITNEE